MWLGTGKLPATLIVSRVKTWYMLCGRELISFLTIRDISKCSTGTGGNAFSFGADMANCGHEGTLRSTQTKVPEHKDELKTYSSKSSVRICAREQNYTGTPNVWILCLPGTNSAAAIKHN